MKKIIQTGEVIIEYTDNESHIKKDKDDEFLDKLFESSRIHNENKNKYITCIKNKNFEGFSSAIEYYLSTACGEENKKEKTIQLLRDLSDFVGDKKIDHDTAIDYFIKVGKVKKSMILMTYWTHTDNSEMALRFQQEPNNNYKKLWERGIFATSEEYDFYLEYFNKSFDFKNRKDFFFSEQKKYKALSLKTSLSESLENKPENKPKFKI